ncbi:hypothetical protein K491DRAFT_682743 [Lophiostoma macrostomum CBS 122681]|uniref:Myb-like domain-containing protein n=1 Tax=Lophiostoma macrostomum CBS 122681 TaxID=1314788 RepID=A0A6A6SUN2_9PLEO|nr:hypothetical protein K491DRAFT_682743 [Lophiostoma macrostomum CBS 122681]
MSQYFRDATWHIDWSTVESYPYVEPAASPTINNQEDVSSTGENASQWTEEEVKVICESGEAGLTSVQIAELLPGRTRRAIQIKWAQERKKKIGNNSIVSAAFKPPEVLETGFSGSEGKYVCESREAGTMSNRTAGLLPKRTAQVIQSKDAQEQRKKVRKTPKSRQTPKPRRLICDGFAGPDPKYKMTWTPEQDEKLLRVFWETGSLEELKKDPDMPSRDEKCLVARRTHLAKIRNDVYLRVMQDYAKVKQKSPALIPSSKYGWMS